MKIFQLLSLCLVAGLAACQQPAEIAPITTTSSGEFSTGNATTTTTIGDEPIETDTDAAPVPDCTCEQGAQNVAFCRIPCETLGEPCDAPAGSNCYGDPIGTPQYFCLRPCASDAECLGNDKCVLTDPSGKHFCGATHSAASC